MSPPHVVLVILEAKVGREMELKAALEKVAKQSRQEEGCLKYQVVQDKANPCLFGLFEQWKSNEIHQQQFSKSYIQEFAGVAEVLLAKPYVALFGNELEIGSEQNTISDR